MVGGIVTETVWLADRIWIGCVDADENRHGKCAIYVERNQQSEKIKPGDSVWWQGGFAMWTPLDNKGKTGNKSGVDYDIRIPRIGSSGVSRPPVDHRGQMRNG